MSIRLEHINYVYSPGTAYEKQALKDISLEIRQGESVGIIGPVSYTHLDVYKRQPQNQVFAEFVKLDADGFILASEDCMTSRPGVFAAGDCRTKEVRQLTTAAADGAVAALAACKYMV